jgi:1-aminocyclopropane-1-carboxylate deaminase/D-cysteine desulfhydrase-like pyridoxal-dependent ACC family enzyme
MKFQETPIIKYGEIDVKREDLCVVQEPGDFEIPGLAKLRGADELLKSLKEKGIENIGVFDTRVSKAGWGVASLCNKLGLNCYCYFPLLKGNLVERQQGMANAWGAKLKKLKGGRTAILYHRAKKDIEKLPNSYMLPLGLVCIETVQAVAKVSQELPKYSTIVVCTGTGTIIAGILAGLHAGNLPKKVIGVSCGMSLKKQLKRICSLLGQMDELEKQSLLQLEMADRDYYQPDNIETPFPCHPYYDKKTWRWLLANKQLLDKPILFWNIGD